MNRKERRAAIKSKPSYMRETKAELTKRLIKNGITEQDLKNEYIKGYTNGFREAAEPVIRGCYAATCLALNDLHGFGQKRCADVLRALDEHLTMTLTSNEAIDEVYKRIGLKLDFKEPFDRVQEV
jgi:hypothetical protein